MTTSTIIGGYSWLCGLMDCERGIIAAKEESFRSETAIVVAMSVSGG